MTTTILRSCGERTTGEALKLLGEAHPLFLITDRPFERTLRRALELAVNQGSEYTVMLDADTLPLPWLLETLLTAARADTSDWFEKHGLVRCKFFGRRGAGNRIYRTALLPRALELLPQYAGELRLETAIIKAMEREGHSRQEIKRVVALHGYEQWCRDIYRTIFTHGVKSRDRIERYLPKWAKAGRRDFDYEIARWAAREGMKHQGTLTIDASRFAEYDHEKPPLTSWAASTRKAWKKTLREEK